VDYELIVDPDALASLRDRVPQAIFPCIERNLYRLSNDPLSRGTKPLIPGPRPGQAYYFDCEAETVFHLAANFIFTIDERAIYVRRVEVLTDD
jgi:hypothetical protein